MTQRREDPLGSLHLQLQPFLDSSASHTGAEAIGQEWLIRFEVGELQPSTDEFRGFLPKWNHPLFSSFAVQLCGNRCRCTSLTRTRITSGTEAVEDVPALPAGLPRAEDFDSGDPDILSSSESEGAELAEGRSAGKGLFSALSWKKRM